jgi:hypothetical protein
MVLIIFFSFCFSLIFYQLLSKSVRYEKGTFNIVEYSTPDSVPPRVNFDTIFDSIMAILQFVLNEEWHVTLYEYSRYYFKNNKKKIRKFFLFNINKKFKIL